MRTPNNSDSEDEFDRNQEGEDYILFLADCNFESDSDSDYFDADEGPAFAHKTLNEKMHAYKSTASCAATLRKVAKSPYTRRKIRKGPLHMIK